MQDLLPLRPVVPRRKPRVIFEVGIALVMAGVVVLLFVAYELVGTNLTAQADQAMLARQFKKATATSPTAAQGAATAGASNLSGGPAPRPKAGAKAAEHSSRLHRDNETKVALPLPPSGGALDHMAIPAIGVDRYVVQGVGEADLQEGPGHYPGTPLPGQQGNVGIAGHRTTFGAPFFRLNELRAGDLIYLTDTSGSTWVYRVQDVWVVAPTDVAVLDPSQRAELTLTTCNPRFEATSRLVVRASLAAHVRDFAPSGLEHLPAAVATARAGRSERAAEVAAELLRHGVAASAPAPAVSALSNQAPARASATSGASGEGAPTMSGATSGAKVEAALGAGHDAWPQLVGWGAVALALWVGVRLLAARQSRYGKVLVIIGGAALCLLPLWFVFENAVGVLPANL